VLYSKRTAYICNAPTLQLEHWVLPVEEAYNPAVQEWHQVEPEVLEYFPTVHVEQLDAPVEFEK
jgi:hypothetical protein